MEGTLEYPYIQIYCGMSGYFAVIPHRMDSADRDDYGSSDMDRREEKSE